MSDIKVGGKTIVISFNITVKQKQTVHPYIDIIDPSVENGLCELLYNYATQTSIHCKALIRCIR